MAYDYSHPNIQKNLEKKKQEMMSNKMIMEMDKESTTNVPRNALHK